MLTDPLVGLDGGGEGLDGGGEGAVGVPPPVLLEDDEEPQPKVTPTQITVDKIVANVFIDPTMTYDSIIFNIV